ncbi:DNA polymerase eta [Procambarus clarkii]|uniref:DNA polymerase eta n=1 Tax=Procambarus clarkii TaxID=6728 RepID=UPI003742ADF4
MTERVVALLDMDCFYVQVEERDHPYIKGVPAAVVQYNTWKGGGIIAVNYEARSFGVKRGMRGDEARSKCPDIQLVQVPVNRGKADLTKYRNAGKEVISVLCDFSDCIERASIDEAYIDFTNVIEGKMKQLCADKITPDVLKSTWVIGFDKAECEDKEDMRRKGIENWLASLYNDEDCALPVTSAHPHWDNLRLTCAAILCEEMRKAVFERTSFKCSAGIAHNKMLAKLSCGLHKPNQQTVLPQCQVGELWENMEVGKIRNLGGKLGASVTDELSCVTMADLGRLSLQQLKGRYDDKTAYWLYNLGKGVDSEPVISRQLPKSVGCGKNFQGKEALNTKEKVRKWMQSLADELSERLNIDQNANKRQAKTLTVSIRVDGDERWLSLSRSCGLPSYSAERISQLGISLIKHTNQALPKDPAWTPAIKNISLSAGKFEDWEGSSSGNIQDMFKKVALNNSLVSQQERMPSMPCEEETHETHIASTPQFLTLKHSDKILDVCVGGSFESIKKHSTQVKDNLINDTAVNLCSLKVHEVTAANRISTESISEKSKGMHENSNNSFFKNFILKNTKNNENACKTFTSLKKKTDDGTSEINCAPNNAEVKEAKPVNTCDGEMEDEDESDLDLLVSFLDKDAENQVNLLNSDDKTLSKNNVPNCADTDTSHSACRQNTHLICESPDLFSSDDSKSSIEVLESRDSKSKTGGIKMSSSTCKATLLSAQDILADENPSDKPDNTAGDSALCSQVGKNTSPAHTFREQHEEKNKCSILQNSEISVEELFPDLENFDASLLPLLPKNLRFEVEKAVALHKANCEKTPDKKYGILKYMSGKPSECTRDECEVENPQSMKPLAIAGSSKTVMPQYSIFTSKQSEDNQTRYTKIPCSENNGTVNVCNSDSFENPQVGSSKNLVQCEECSCYISAFELPEHMDYHVALKLQNDMQQERDTATVIEKGERKVSPIKHRPSKGKKRGKTSKVETYLESKKIKTIDLFFKR